MPRNRRPKARLLDERHLVVGDEVGAVDSFGNGQQIGVAIKTKTRVHQVKIAIEKLHGIGWRAVDRLRAGHCNRMAALVLRGSAIGIAQRLGVTVWVLLEPAVERRAAVTRDGAAGLSR